MPAKLPHYLTRSRHGIYYLRIVRDGRECRRSLRTRDPATARAASYKFGAILSGMKDTDKKGDILFAAPEVLDTIKEVTAQNAAWARIERLESQAREDAIFQELLKNRPDLATRTAPAAATPAPTTTPSTTLPRRPLTIKAGVDAYMRSRDGQITENTKQAWLTHTNRLIAEFKPDQLIHEVTPGALIDSYKRLERDGRAIKTVKMYCQTWRLVWDWWISQGYTTENPVTMPTYGKAVAERMNKERGRERKPWLADDLRKVFDPARLDELHRPEDAFLPLLGLFTGARIEALARLKTSDFIEYAPGRWAIRFDGDFDKTGRERDTPLHQTAIDAGVLDYVEDIKASYGEGPIFPHLKEVDGSVSHYPAKQFGETRKKLRVQKGTDFHAFRTTLISVLKLNHCGGDVRRAFVGHETGEKIDVHTTHYEGLAYGPERLADAVLPLLDFSIIGYAWQGWRYTPGSAIAAIKAIQSKQKRREMLAAR